MTGGRMEPLPEPHEIFERTREDGRRRLERPLLELSATALVAGFHIVIGLVALTAAEAALTPRLGASAAPFVGALVFGIAFVLIVVGRTELFTENFLVPLAGLDSENRRSWYKFAELWTVSPLVNVAGGVAFLLVATS